MDEITTIKKVIIQGHSMMIPLTRELRQLGIVPDDYICVKISKIDPKTISVKNVRYDGFDPAPIGDKVAKFHQLYHYNDDELRTMIKTFDMNPAHVEAICDYVKSKIWIKDRNRDRPTGVRFPVAIP